ncbi:MAG: hypothetical protein ACTSR8_08535 [Promethearchaeota archaeon]
MKNSKPDCIHLDRCSIVESCACVNCEYYENPEAELANSEDNKEIPSYILNN